MIDRSAQAAYLAGFIDGEGCFGLYERPGASPRMTFHLGGRDEILMRSVQKMLLDEDIHCTWCRRSDRTFMLQTERKSELRKILDLVIPYMVKGTQKRRKAERIRAILSQPALEREVQRL